MTTEKIHMRTGLGLCILTALATVVVMVKIGLDLGSLELPAIRATPSEARGIPMGEPAPEFALRNLDGNLVRLSDQRT